MSTLTSLGAKASRITEQVSDFSREAGDKLDHARNETAGSLHAAASSIRRGGRQGSHAIANLANGTADTLDDAASYVKKHDLKRTIGESRQLVRQYPAESRALAAGVGFLAGFAVRQIKTGRACDKSS